KEHDFDLYVKLLWNYPELKPHLRLVTVAGPLRAQVSLMPEAHNNAVLATAPDMSLEQVGEEVANTQVEDETSAEVGRDDLMTAMRRTPRSVVFVNGPEELRDILAHPFDTWRIFVHPVQRRVALRPSYGGPAQVTGGAGTGKTVTALHRAKFLASKGGRVLLTTFTRNLAEALEEQLALLVDDPDVRERIHVKNVDSLAYEIVGRHHRPAVAGDDVLDPL